VDVTSTLDAPYSAGLLFAAIDDIAWYPKWLNIVTKAVPTDPAAGDPGPAWLVDLRGRLGPLARSKRLRMVRTEFTPDTAGGAEPRTSDARRHIRFERRELDGRDHAAWVLDADVVQIGDGSRLTMRLHYGGTFGGALLERMLRDEIEASRPRLLTFVETTGS